MPQVAITTPLAAGHDLVTLARGAVAAAEAIFSDAATKVRERVTVDGRIVSRTFDREQRATHGLAWLATYVEAVRQLAAYAERMQSTNRLGEIEELLVRIGLGEYLAQILGGIPISQGEIVRLSDLGLTPQAVAARVTPEVDMLIASGNTAIRRARLVELMRGHKTATVGVCGLDDMLESIRDEMRKFADSEVIDHAQGWHRTNSYIPMEVIGQMADLGVFGLTIPEEFGGMGLGKEFDVRRLRRAVARLYRRRLARHPHRDRRRARFSAAAPTSRRRSGCRSSRPARSCRPRCSPSRTPVPILRR